MITPDWNVPQHIKAFTTTRENGVSQAPYDFNNLGAHVGDNVEHVMLNRARLNHQLPSPPLWLNQCHTTEVVEHSLASAGSITADASYSHESEQVCCVMTADCLPVLITNKLGTQVAAVHAGWRGLCDGIIENTLSTFSGSNDELVVWLGPAIGPNAFEVGSDVMEQFVAVNSDDQCCFTVRDDRYLADIYQLARNRLRRAGVCDITGGDYCTVTQSSLFFSYRRDGQTGRMASLIWIEK